MLELIEQVYAAAADPSAWEKVIDDLARELGARTVTLTITDATGNSVMCVTPMTDRSCAAQAGLSTAIAGLMSVSIPALQAGEVTDFEQLGLSQDAFKQTDFYREILAPHRFEHGLVLSAPAEGGVGVLVAYRSAKEGRFKRKERELLRSIAPHIGRVVTLNLQSARLRLHCDSMSAILDRNGDGLLAVDAQARVLYANHAAQNILRDNAKLKLADGALRACDPAVMAELQAAITSSADDAAQGILTIAGPGTGGLQIEVVSLAAEAPLRPAAIVFLKRPTSLPTSEQIQDLLQVTPAQAALARELLNGDGIPAAAIRLGISRSTARTHLQELFQTTGTNRQAELVRFILQQKPIGRSDLSPRRKKKAKARVTA